MRMELALENGRPVAEMDDQELARMFESTTALLNLNPALPVWITAAEALRLLEADGYLMRVEGQSGYEVARHEHWRTSPKAMWSQATCPACSAALTAGLMLSAGLGHPYQPEGLRCTP
jgi:hypothetical protein